MEVIKNMRKTMFMVIFYWSVYFVSVKSTYVYLTNQTTVMRFNTETLPLNQPEVLYSGTGYIRALAIDDVNNHLYWSDMRYNTINQSLLNGENVKTLFNYAIGFVQSLSVDWSSNNIYWTDSLMKVIEVSTTTGQHRKVLFQLDKTDQPRGLICNSEAGYLFWTDWGKNPKIERSSLSGSDRKSIISTNLRWPNDLDIDYQSSRLYWIDAFTDTLESSNFDGAKRKIEVKLKYLDEVIHPYSFAYHLAQNVTYITDWFSDSLYSMNGGFNNDETKIFYTNSDKQKLIGQVRISGENRITNAFKPCLTSDNKCTHLCYKVSGTSHVCGCPTGMVADGASGCKETERDFEIYFADSLATSVNHVIKYKDQPGFTIRPLPLPTNEKLQYPIALDYNQDEQKIYWTDAKTKKLYRMKENGNNFEVVSRSVSSFALAIDELSNVLYYFDNTTKAIIMSSLDGTYTKIIKSDNLKNIYDIAIHEEKGYIFYTDYENSVIARIDIDGKQFLTTHNYVNPVTGNLIRNTVRATGLTVDKNENRLYWCDGGSYQIRSTDLDFQNPRTIIQETYFFRSSFWLLENIGNVIQPFSLAVLNDKIYWTDTYKRAIYETNKRFGGNIEFITGGLNHPRDIHVFNDAPRIETDKIYLFSFSKTSKYRARCVRNNTCQPINKTIVAPANCPSGYKETRYTSRCSNCSDALGANFVCPCTDWATCAQRTYGKIYGCHPVIGFMHFKVRECTKTIKPGKCSYSAQNICPIIPEKDCKADQDCDGVKKCCRTKCGMKCSSPVTASDHPCKVNNGGCSHFCMAKQYEYKCMCPDGMFLSADRKTCSKPSCETKICRNGGKCIPLANGGSYCRCSEKYWIGASCAIDLRNQVIIATFGKKTKRAILFSKFNDDLAMSYKDFCQTYPCAYNMEPIIMTRGRRAVATMFYFTREDIYDHDFKETDTSIVYTFVLTKHRDENRVIMGNLDQDSMLAGLKNFGIALATKYGMTFQNTSVSPQVNGQDEDKGISYGIIAIIVVLIIIAIALFFAVFYFLRIKRKKKLPPPSGPAPSGNSGNVRWQFENQLYDDLNQPPVTLPPIAIDGESITNQRAGSRAGSRTGSRAGGGANSAAVIPVIPVDVNKVPKEWVRFEKDDEKPPITDFVSAELYSDPYNLEDPPEYTSRAATPVGSIRLPNNKSYKI